MNASVSLVLDAQDIVGESIVWSPDEKALYWVDIVGKRIHRLEPDTGRHDLWQTPDFVTSIGMRADGGFIVGLRQTVCLWEPDGNFEPFAFPEPELPENRLNEGRVAPDGSFWVATMRSNLNPDGSPRPMESKNGAVYRIDPSGNVTPLTGPDYGIPNTMAWTADNRFVLADTLENEIYLFDYDPAAPAIGNRRILCAGLVRGLPDGSCLDEKGRLWNCRVGGGAALARIGIDDRAIDFLDLPASWPTSCTFGGGDLATLYVTSARFTMTRDHLDRHPQEGGLYSVMTGARGTVEAKFGTSNSALGSMR